MHHLGRLRHLIDDRIRKRSPVTEFKAQSARTSAVSLTGKSKENAVYFRYMALVKISITLKPTLLDAQGRVVQSALHSLGYANVDQVRIGKYMELNVADGPEIDAQVRDMCEKLLANPVIEEYRYEVVR